MHCVQPHLSIYFKFILWISKMKFIKMNLVLLVILTAFKNISISRILKAIYDLQSCKNQNPQENIFTVFSLLNLFLLLHVKSNLKEIGFRTNLLDVHYLFINYVLISMSNGSYMIKVLLELTTFKLYSSNAN